MNRLVASALHVGMGAVLVLGLSACNRDANADGGVGATAQQAAGQDGAKFARVVSVTPVREQATAPQQVCHDEVVTQHKPVQDTHQIAGTAIGAVAGGLLGNQIGRGKGNTAATVVGAVGGAVAGHQTEKYVRAEKQTQVTVRFDDGSTRTLVQEGGSRWQVGDRVRLNNGSLQPN